MDNSQLVSRILDKSNYNEISKELTDFVKTYIQKLVSDITLYVDSDISIDNIEHVDKYTPCRNLSQEITGLPSAYSAVDGDCDILVQFAESYARLGIDKYDELCMEAIVDFLNLHNGLFIVLLSKLNICELSLNAPAKSVDLPVNREITGNITVIHIKFKFGVVKFYLLEL